MGFPILVRWHLYIESGPRVPFQYPIRHLIVRSREVPVLATCGTWELSFRSRFRSLNATRFVFRIVRSLWNVTGTSAALLPMYLSDSKVIWWFKLLISRLWDFMRSYDKTSYRILKQGLGRGHMWWTPLPGTRLADSWSINCHFVYPEMLVRYCPENPHFLQYLMLCFRYIYFHNHLTTGLPCVLSL